MKIFGNGDFLLHVSLLKISGDIRIVKEGCDDYCLHCPKESSSADEVNGSSIDRVFRITPKETQLVGLVDTPLKINGWNLKMIVCFR